MFDEGLRRNLIVIAARDYPGAGVAFAEGIDAQVAAVHAWWASERLKERSFDIQAPATLKSRTDLEEFVHSSGLRLMDESDVVTLYVTGHGLSGGSRRHYLLLPESDEERPINSAYPTAELVASLLDSQAGHILVIVNSCYAGKLRGELADLRMDLRKHRRDLSSLAVFASADFDEAPRVLEFTQLLSAVDRQLRSDSEIDSPHLSFEQFHAELRRAARALELLQPISLWSDYSQSDPSPCLPNPGYSASVHVVDEARRQVSTSAAELDHWLGRASGRTGDGDRSWYFSGRNHINRMICRFLDHGTGTLVVTGGAGTGKSAVLARAVTLSDATLRSRQPGGVGFLGALAERLGQAPDDTVPAPGSVDLAVLARNKDSTTLLGELLGLLGADQAPNGPLAQRERLRERLRAAGKIWTIVIDALDEASNPFQVVSDVVIPLSRLDDAQGVPLARLVLGLRSSAPGATPGPPDERDDELLTMLRRTLDPMAEVRTDGEGTLGDIKGYVSALLSVYGPYASDEFARAQAAAKIGEAVAPSFLDARFAAQQLRAAETRQDLDDPAWLDTLQDGTVGLLRQDLRSVADDFASAEELLAVLQATAFAQGPGIPRAEIWPALVEAVLGRPAPEADALINRVLGSRLGGYLGYDTGGGRIVRRPAHERLAEVLRREPGRLLDGESP